MLILNCDNLINSCCSDYALASTLSIIYNIINLIHIIVPIILLVMVTINLTQLVANPEEKKLLKKLTTKVLAAILVFFIPTIMNVFLNMLPNNMEVYGCMQQANKLNTLSKSNKVIYKSIYKEKKKTILNNSDEYEKGEKRPEKADNNGNSSTVSNNPNITKDGSILLIAGHSYPPYCSTGGLGDCRGPAKSGYAEEDETRKLVKLIKSNLDSLGVKSDIANAILAGDTDKMNRSFYIESRMNTSLFKQYNWNQYKFVLEVHFNATSSGSAQGTLLCKKSSSYSTKADNDIVNAVIRHTGNKRLGDSIQSLNNVSYFSSRGIPITYLETEFYDNAMAMKNYTIHINEIARDIALAIQKNYG